MKQVLKAGLEAVMQTNRARFHMPGHKGISGFSLPLEWDFTEIPETDDLHDPTGIIQESQRQAALLLHAKESFYLVNGASGGLQAAILSVCGPGDRVVIPRNAHQAIHFGIEFAGARPLYLLPQEVEPGIYAELNLEDFRRMVETQEPKAAVFTYPTYEGICWDLEPFLSICRDKGVISIVDEAHGAHLPFFSTLPPSSLEMGADLVVASVHKMLPAPTQTAILHRGTDAVPAGWIREALHRTQTSSPSYLLLLGIEEALAWMEGIDPKEEVSRVETVREQIHQIEGIELMEGEAQDPYKFLLRGSRRGLNGPDLFRALRAAGIEPEWQQGDWVLLLASPCQSKADFKRLTAVLENLPAGTPIEPASGSLNGFSLPDRVCSTLEARRAPRKMVAIDKSIGQIVAENLTPYPPGIPLMIAGERMNEEIAAVLLAIQREGRRIYGANHRIPVIDEGKWVRIP